MSEIQILIDARQHAERAADLLHTEEAGPAIDAMLRCLRVVRGISLSAAQTRQFVSDTLLLLGAERAERAARNLARNAVDTHAGLIWTQLADSYIPAPQLVTR